MKHELVGSLVAWCLVLGLGVVVNLWSYVVAGYMELEWGLSLLAYFLMEISIKYS
jgi:hypothetical protein